MTEVNEMTDVIDDKGKVAAVKSLSKMLALPSLRQKLYQYIYPNPLMKQVSVKSKSVSHTHSLVSSTIDQILTKGANKLYDKYIYSKIPASLSQKLSDAINVMFDPLTNENQQFAAKRQERIHESIINKINVAQQEKNNRYSGIYASRAEKTLLREGSRIAKEKKLRYIENSADFKQVVRGKVEDEKKALKKLKGNEADESIEVIRIEREKRYEEQIAKEKEEEAKVEAEKRKRQQLEKQLKELEESNKNVTFDYEDGKLLIPKKEPKFNQESSRPKPKIIMLNFTLEDKQHHSKNSSPRSRQVKNIRKITTFQRTRRNNWHEMDDQSYNNNGERQFSTIPYLEIEEGVKMTQKTGQKVERPQSCRKPGTASTHRTFKSYTRERLQSFAVTKTIDIATTNINTRYQCPESKQSKRTVQSPKRSLLWSSRTCSKDHKINKNLQHFGTYFDLSGQTIE